jgi:Ca2+-binding RTX toxin-like protein
MSHTVTRSRRFSRIAAGLTVAAAATATTLLGAAPASAATPILVRMSGTTMIITGTTIGDRASTSGGNGTVTAVSSSSPVAAGTGCQQSGAGVLCTGVSSIRFTGRAGNDVFRNDTAVPSDLFGDAGNDQLIGGSGRDFIRGGGDQDAASGQAGNDDCIAEIESTCEV